MLALAIEITDGYLSAGLVTEKNDDVAHSFKQALPQYSDSASPLEQLISDLDGVLQKAPEKPMVITTATDYTLTPDRRGVVNFPTAPRLDDVRLADIMEQRFGIPARLDLRSATFLKQDRLAFDLAPSSLCFGCYVGDTYESATWCQNTIHRGKNTRAGNIGHMPIHGREDTCYCGKNGCVELYGSGYRLKQMHSLIFSDIPLEEIFARHARHPLLLDFLHMMIYPVAVVAKFLDPDFIVLGGFVPSMPGFPLPLLEEELQQQTGDPTLTLYPSGVTQSNSLACIGHQGLKDFS
ncbi:MAG: ROK family protein [Planctomycetota bacterium]|jgi:predicted NBD/HSP70 family sugar kinase|nr:ROK family protein [Planctomycetota bacterium]